MKAFSIFDDFPDSSIRVLENEGVCVDLLLKGQDRPSEKDLKELLSEYDILFISTAQKMSEDFFQGISTPKIIGTASSGKDHIHIPINKQSLIKIANAPYANRITVAEHVFGLILSLRKAIFEGRKAALEGKTKKSMSSKPRDLYGSTIGVVGAGVIASRILEIADYLGMKCLCWTPHPDRHRDLKDKGVIFVCIDELLSRSDIVSVSIPLNESSRNLINSERVAMLKKDSVFISTSRIEVIDKYSIFEKAKYDKSFGVGLDVDAKEVEGLWTEDMDNVIVTPHIGGGTIESRVRLFDECTMNVVSLLKEISQ